ncbi:MAG TPA: MEDS domain-containing protein [Nitrososphaera sp.]|nr:MEDS domain-containing protein [Nitrososphaera sp.]
MDYRPLKFVDRLKGSNHIVVLYDEQKYADMVIARYLLNGLEKGESCIFFTPDPPEEVEKRLAAMSINVDLYKRKNQLRVFNIERSDDSKRDVLNTLKYIRGEAAKGMKPPFRFVGKTITDTSTIEGGEVGNARRKDGPPAFCRV